MLKSATVEKPLERVAQKTFSISRWGWVGIFAFFSTAQAELVRIIHTNDLHSQFVANGKKTPQGVVNAGGYARVRRTILDLQERSRMEGLSYLTLDAGDFSEGSPFYLASGGSDSFRLMQAMPFDATTLGNHDWLMGPEMMENLFGAHSFPFPVLVSNFAVIPSYRNTDRALQNSKVFERGETKVKIAVIGLTTDEQVYKWRAPHALISAPVQAFEAERKALMTMRDKSKRPDFIVALTHIGVEADKNLVKKTAGLDIVVGGHSHTTLKKALWQKNAKGKPVAIVQAGMHGHYVGNLLVDLTPGQPLKVVSYELVPVDIESDREAIPTLLHEELAHSHDSEHEVDSNHSVGLGQSLRKTVATAKTRLVEALGYEEAVVNEQAVVNHAAESAVDGVETYNLREPSAKSFDSLVINAKRNLEKTYGKEWIAHVVGRSSKDILSDTHELQPWNHLVARSLKSVVEARVSPSFRDRVISFDCSMFHGANHVKGDITRYDLFSLYPRVFDVQNHKGWTVWQGAMLGYRLSLIVEQAEELGFPFYSEGMTCGPLEPNEHDELSGDGSNGRDKCTFGNIRINGKRLKYTDYYYVAVPEGVAKGMQGMPSLVPLIPGNLKDTGVFISDAIESQLIKEKKEF